MAAMIVTSILLMSAAVILRKIFGRKLNGRVLMLMWAVVFIKLAVPVNIPSAVSVMNLFSAKSEAAVVLPPPNAENPTEAAPAVPSEKSYNAPVPEAAEKGSFDIKKAVFSIYFAAAVFLELAVLGAYIICSVRFSRLENLSVGDRFSEKGIRFKKSKLGTPAVFGIFRPMILIPENTDMTDSRTLTHIILHEKTHIRHCDQLFNLLTLMICCANWYDPLAWVCRTLYLRDVEKWCDEAVIDAIGSENRKSYAAALLACAAERSHPLMLISGFGESDIKARIKAISENKRLRRGVSAAAVILIIAAAAVFGTGRAMGAEMTFSGFVPTENGFDYTQKFSGSNGEAAAVTVNLNHNYGEYQPANYYHFTIGIDSGEYTISEPRAEMRMNGVKLFRVLPDGERTDDSSVTYNADFSSENDLELAITFDNKAAPTLEADIFYKLKKGNFTVGNYTMNVVYDTDMLYEDHINDLNIITELGLPGLIHRCNTWDMVFCSDTYIDESAYNEDGYYEYRFPDDDTTVTAIEEAAGVEPTFYVNYCKCPFSTADELRENARRLFSEEYINAAYSNFFSELKEDNGLLYARLGGKGFPGGWINDAFIHEMSDDTIDFTAEFLDGHIGTYSVRYTVIMENGNWKLHKREYLT